MLKDYYVNWETLLSQVLEHEDALVGGIAVSFLQELEMGQCKDGNATPLKDAFFAPYVPSYPYIAELAVNRYTLEDSVHALEEAIGKAERSTNERGDVMVNLSSITFDVDFKIRMHDFIEDRMAGILMSIISDEDMVSWSDCAVLLNETRDRHAIVDVPDASKLIIRAIPLRYIKRVDDDQSKASRTDLVVVVFVRKDAVRMCNLTIPAILPEAVDDLNIQRDLLDQDTYSCFIVRIEEDGALDTDELEEVRKVLAAYEADQRSFYHFCEDNDYPCYFAGPNM